MNISNNIASIQAHQTMMDVNANNIANVKSDGFTPKDTKITNEGNSVDSHVRTQTDNTQTDLAKEITQQINIENITKANVTAIKTQDAMLGSLLDTQA